ncbi:MAG: helix-turn-helix domain-containing protein [Candidatus Thorarchaeota archaeon]|jgi:sugar-specific transcriptional regulator TrmB
MQKKSGINKWEEKLTELIREAGVLDDEDASVYLALLKNRKPLTGNQISSIFPDLKRTHIYSILNRLQQDELVEIKNPGKRPAEYEALDPLRPIETAIRAQKDRLQALDALYQHIKTEVVPRLSKTGIFGGRVSSTFVIPDRNEFLSELRNNIESAKIRVMGHITQELLLEIKNPLYKATTRIRNQHQDQGYQMTWEYARDHHAITVATDTPDITLEKDYPSSFAFGEKSIETEILIIDNTTYLSNLDTKMGLALKIEDESVTEVYRMVVINTYLEASFASQTSNSINSIGKFVGSNHKVREMVKKLLKKGWRISKENTDTLGYETGIIAPTSGLGLFRLGGIIYYPTGEDDAQEILNRQFEKFVNQSDYFVQSLQRQFDVTRKTKTKKIANYDAQILEITLKIRDEWKPVLEDLPEAMLSPKGLTGPALVGLNLDNMGAFLVWGLNPENVSHIMETLFGYL